MINELLATGLMIASVMFIKEVFEIVFIIKELLDASRD